MSTLTPTTKEFITLSSGQVVEVPKCELSFSEWKGQPIDDNYGGKQVVELDGQSLFVELAILRILEKEDWLGVWVDSFGRCLRKEMSPSKIQYSAIANTASEVFNIISEQELKGGGCWDVLAWKKENILFVECKRSKKDRIQKSQVTWLERCLSLGLKPENFLLVEWDVN